MQIQASPPLHLTYCLNIHPGESGPDVLQVLSDCTARVRARVAPSQRFGLGLRLAARAAEDFSQRGAFEQLTAVLAEHDLYAFTINGFPYGRFHAGPVKEQVYQPDWSHAGRVHYTRQLGSLLAQLLPRDGEGSISTVPVGGPGRLSDDAERVAVEHLASIAAHLEELSFRRGQDLHLGLEPEPGCHLETTSQTIDFLQRVWRDGVPLLVTRLGMRKAEAEGVLRKRLGVCFDTCHVALQFEDLAWAWDRYLGEGIRLSKVQLSAALACSATADARAALQPFVEPTYLHQAHARRSDGVVWRWVDLPDALEAWKDLSAGDEVRVHFHVPLFWPGSDVLRSTAGELTPPFWERLRRGACAHLEIETYTFDVLPRELRPGNVVDSICAEYDWVLRFFSCR